MKLDPLYKITASGAVQVWEIEIDERQGRFRTISGQTTGKKITAAWTQCTAKNVNRINHVPAREQAIREAKAAWDKKLKDGYSISPGEAHIDERFKCMTAHHYNHPDDKGRRKTAALKAGDDLYSQPKLDGIRLIATKSAMLSRKNRPIVMAPHIAEALVPVFERFPELVFDGELYNHDYRDDFDGLVSLARKQKPTEEEFEQASVLEYWVYDIAGSAAQMPYRERFSMLAEALLGASPSLKVVRTEPAPNEEWIDHWYMKYLGEGYEGQMLRFANSYYENKRSAFLLKRKETEDKEFQVLDIVEGIGNRAGQAGFATVLEVDRKGAEPFNTGIKANKERREELLRDRTAYIGGEVTVSFNGRTTYGVPRFPRATAWYPGGRTL